MEYKLLSNGVKIPMIGYGVFQVKKEDTKQCVLNALKVGYRHIDTAQVYLNEEEVGQAIVESGVDRKEIFITTKVWVTKFSYEECRKSVLLSMKRLKTDYLDLVLLHQPFNDTYAAWRALEDLYLEGKIRAIGVSNWLPFRIVDFCEWNRIAPMVNQIEMNVFNQQLDEIPWNEKYNVSLEAWAPFAQGRNDTFTNETLVNIGKKYGKSAAQVMLRWLIQRGIVVLPRSVHEERMIENLNVFDFQLSEEDMEAIKALDTNKSTFFDHYDPEIITGMIQRAKVKNV